jgi:hypothetical protein
VSGIYIVIGLTDNQSAIVVEVGESHNVRHAVETHVNKSCWEKLRGIALAFGYLQVQDGDGDMRSEILKRISSSNKTIF